MVFKMHTTYLWLCAIFTLMTKCRCDSIDFVTINRESIYEFEGSVHVLAQAPWDQIDLKLPKAAGFRVRGTVKFHRNAENALAASLAVEKITVNKQHGNAAVFYQNKEMQTLYNPFKIIYTNDTITHVQFKATDAMWSRNFKRSIAAALQLKGLKNGAYVEEEPGIHGVCSTEYYVTSKSNGHLSIRKNPVLHSCIPHNCGIHSHRSNVPENKCFDSESEKNVIVGNEAMYDLAPIVPAKQSNNFENYYLHRLYVEGNTMFQTFLSTGESQLLFSKLELTFSASNEIINEIDVTNGMTNGFSNLTIEEHPISDVTGERQTFQSAELVQWAMELLGDLANSLENRQVPFDEPYEVRVADVIRVFSRCDLNALKALYQRINVGTSYQQETMRNLFYDIIPRTGTVASVMLTRDLIVNNLCKSTTALQLLIILPFHITNYSPELVTECEPLMKLSSERPDVQQIGILSFATIVHNSYRAGQLSDIAFEKYVRTYFEHFIDNTDYELKLLYLQGLGNLKLGKVTEYLDPIIRDETQSNDIRFMATWIKESVAEQSSSNERRKNYETFWPIFENRSAPIELRVAAFNTLLRSNPTSARLMSIHTLMENETNPHLVNFYRTTLMSLAGTTQPCYQKLRRLASSMIRHLPKAPAKRHWVTGNYIFDYRSNEYGMGALFQTLLIGDGKTHLPQIAFFKFQQEAMGKYTDQITLYIKARGLDHLRFGHIVDTENGVHINMNELRKILSSLKMPTVKKAMVHLEIIVQIEGKAILFLFLNQESYNKLTEGDVLNRIMKLVHMNSHINLQNLRWPFHSRFSVPTVLGTPTSLSVGSTALTSLRGNITQLMPANEISRTHQIEIRHSLFTAVTSKSYNPFLNMEHSISREQGLLFYLPINNEVKLNLFKSSLWFSFYRPSNLISGISLKSRIRIITRGRPLRTNNEFYDDIVVYEGDPSIVASELINNQVEDLGLMITGVSHPFDIMSHMKLMFHMEPSINTFVYHEMEPFMKLFGLVQVNGIHIGTNKKFTLLFHNTKDTKLEGTLIFDSKPFLSTWDPDQKFDLTIEHKCGVDVLHKLSIVLVTRNDKAISNSKQSDQMKFDLDIVHTNKNNDLWMLKGEATYEPIVFLKRPYTLRGSISFGNKSISSNSIEDDSTNISFDIFADILNNAKMDYNKNTDRPNCPREILKFAPPPQNSFCDKNAYRDLTTVHDYGLNITFLNNPEWLEHALIRLDYFTTSISSQKDLYKFNERIDILLNTFSNKLQLDALLNGKNITILNLPLWLNRHLNAKYDRPEQMALSFGSTHMCSIISSIVSTLDDKSISLENYTKPNCSVLLVADCSFASKFALFVAPTMENGIQTFSLQLHLGDDIVFYTPRKLENDLIQLKNGTEIVIETMIHPLEDLRIFVNEENLLIFEVFEKIQIQYNRGEVLTVAVPSSMKAKLCGLCSLPFNKADDYSYCS